MLYLISLATILLSLGLFFIFKNFINKHSNTICKVVSLLLCSIFVGWFLIYGNPAIINVLALNVNNIFSSSFVCFITLLAMWLMFASRVILQMYPFFKFNIIKNYAKTFCFGSSVLNFGLIPFVVKAFTNSYALSVCSILIAVEIGLSVAYSLYIASQNNWFKIKKSELKEFFVALIVVLLFSMPVYAPRVIFGNITGMTAKSFDLGHRLYLYLSFVILFGLYFLLRRKDKEYARMSLLYISLTALICYITSYDYSIFVTPTSWPLHLCNTAMFVVPLCLIFKWEKVFYFTLFINVLGAFFAMFMPNYNEAKTIFDPDIVKFWVNHIQAFIMPALIVFLKVYDRPKLKHFVYAMIAFMFYFLLVLFINAWFTNFKADVDFFFLNSDFIAEKLGLWAENLRNIKASFSIGGLTFVFYPLYQFLFFLVYVVLGLIMWFVYVYLFMFQDFYEMLYEKNRKIKLDEIILCEKHKTTEVSDCMSELSKEKLVLSHVYKKYGNNKNYAVEDINFEVNAGEVLGFLGPNGAGKSTIIKCIVGIQPQTDGEIELNGFNTLVQPVEAKKELGFVPDHYALYENLTGREYVNYIADLYEVSKEDRDERFNHLIEILNMEMSIDNKIKTYSHGMKQKITIMSALVHNPKLWILDEPLTGLDPISIYQVKECMKEHAKKGNIVFFSSHIIDVVEKICDRIIILNNHHIEANVTLDELKQKGISLEDFYLNTIGQKIEEDK